MELKGHIRLDITDTKQAIAEYVGKVYGVKIAPEKVSIYPAPPDNYGASYGVSVSVEAPVAISNGENQ